MYIQRQLKDMLQRARDSFPVILITGPRQSGKTTFLRNECEEAHYVSFDDPFQRRFVADDPEGFLNQFGYEPVILDEVQYVPELFVYLKMRVDARRDVTGRYLMSGSQQFQLMQNISDSLAGRIAILELLPFSYSEMRSHAFQSLQRNLWFGSFPENILNPDGRDLWLRSYIQTYLERDVKQLKQIRDQRAFEEFTGLVAASHGQELNMARLSRQCGISQPACKQWISVLQACYAIRLLPPYHNNFGKRLVKSPKIYMLDSGVVAELTRQPDENALTAGAMGGAVFEGWVVMEAYKAFAAKGARPDLFFWRSRDGLEVDLIIQKGQELFPVEIKLTATPKPGHMHDIERFRKLVGNTTHPGLLVCQVKNEKNLPGGHKAIPWHYFPEWLASL